MKRALLIGISYSDTAYTNIDGAHNDVTRMKDLLTGLYGFDGGNITCLIDDDLISKDKQPIRQTIMDEMASLINGAVAGDTFVFYYSGHGMQVRRTDSSGSNVIVENTIMPTDFVENGLIDSVTISTQLLQQVPVGATLLCLFDSCHSGSMGELEYNFVYASPRMSTENIAKWGNHYVNWLRHEFIVNGSVMIFSSCLDQQESGDAKADGIFTSLLLQSLQNYNHQATYREVLKSVSCMALLSGVTQRAQFSCSDMSLFDTCFLGSTT